MIFTKLSNKFLNDIVFDMIAQENSYSTFIKFYMLGSYHFIHVKVSETDEPSPKNSLLLSSVDEN